VFPALSLSPKSHGTSENSTVLERRYGSRSIPVNSRVIWRSRVEVRRDSPDKYVWQFFHTTKNTPLRLFFFLPLFFPRFSPRTRFFFHLFEIFFFVCGGGRDLDFLEHVRGVFHNDRKGKKPKNTQRARAKRRKRRSDQTRGNVFYSFSLSLSLSLSLRVCIFYYNKARAKNGFKLYILRVCGNDASQLFNCRDQKSIGPRSLGVKLAPGSKIKKATAMHAKANVALDSSTSVTSSLGA